MAHTHVYDFDGTIYDGDSTVDFYKYCIKKYPLLLCILPLLFWTFIRYLLHSYTKTQFKEKFYRFLIYIPHIEEELTLFWNTHFTKIKPWYLENKSASDIIISASPEFLLLPICQQLDISYLIASKVDKKTGKYIGLNCYGEEKLNRLKKEYPHCQIDTFYSDSLSDQCLASISASAFLVKGSQIIPWYSYKESLFRRFKNTLFNGQFLLFLIIGSVNALNGVLFSFWFGKLLDPNTAFICGYLCSLLISYLLNSKITFKKILSFTKMIKFFLSYIPNFILQNCIVILFYNILNWNKLLTYVLSALIGIPITFLILKVYAFRSKHPLRHPLFKNHKECK